MIGYPSLGFALACKGNLFILKLKLFRAKEFQSVFSLSIDGILYLDNLCYLVSNWSFEADINGIGVVV